MRKLLLFCSMVAAGLTASAQSWTMQNVGFTTQGWYPFDMSAPDANTCWAIAHDGSGGGANIQQFSRTIDGGNFWQAGFVTGNTNYAFSCISAMDASVAYAMMYDAVAGAGGGIFKTTDGGQNWVQSGVGSIYDANSFPNVVNFWDADNGFSMGDPNTGYFEIYTTNDGGTTWNRTPQANIPAPLSGEWGFVNCYDVQGDNVWFGTNKGRVFKTTDRGLNWTVSNVPNSASRSITVVAFRDANNGLCVSAPTSGASALYGTSDGGTTWTLVTTSGPFYSSEVANIPGTPVWLSCGASSTMRGSSYSLNDGLNWTAIDTSGMGTVDGYTELEFLDINTGWAGGFAVDVITDGVYKWNPGILSVGHTRPEAEIMAYPNPSTGIVNLNLKTRNQDVAVTVVDMQGKTVLNQRYVTGAMFKKTFDLTSLPAGVYTFIAQSGSESVQQRVVVQ